MFSRQKIATVSGLLGSIAVIAGAAHAYAYADQPPADCKTSAQGEITCVHKSETIQKDKSGKTVVKQTQDCSTEGRPRVVFPDGLGRDGGSLQVGPVVDCSNTLKLPKGFKKPHIEF
ncbi:hypothetical protein [Streptomyces sp. NPDC006739]|uniref:hypothetical protein n=1 Tax=Streptomyces sp. NPDC006739 TaxID=3364763 RepID=UPI00369C0E2E